MALTKVAQKGYYMFFSKNFIELSEAAQLAKKQSVACSTNIAMIVNYAAIGVIYNGIIARNTIKLSLIWHQR